MRGHSKPLGIYVGGAVAGVPSTVSILRDVTPSGLQTVRRLIDIFAGGRMPFETFIIECEAPDGEISRVVRAGYALGLAIHVDGLGLDAETYNAGEAGGWTMHIRRRKRNG